MSNLKALWERRNLYWCFKTIRSHRTPNMHVE